MQSDYMEEILSKTTDSNVPLKDQEHCLLRLREFHEVWGHGYYVQKSRTRWDGDARELVWDLLQNESFPTIGEAKIGYAELRRDLERQGFIYSDMDLF
jgi:hypothetical protein